MPQSQPTPFTTRPELRGTFGVVSSTHWLASATAMSILERGGNAFDAATAGAFVLQVVEPHLNGPGGEVPLLIWSEKERRVRVLCGQGTAPALSTPQTFRAMGLGLIPGIGVLPAVVPGAFTAWMLLLRDYGTMSPADVLKPAIDYARDGFPLVPRISQAILAVRALFDSEWHSSRDVWLPDGKVPRPGELFAIRGLRQHTRESSTKRARNPVASNRSKPRCTSGRRALWRAISTASIAKQT